MKTSTERAEFSERLQSALRNANQPDKHATKLAREFNARFSGSPITVHAARKWLMGESIPTQDKLRALSGWLGVTAEWLRFGGTVEGRGARSSADQGLEAAQNRLLADFFALDDAHRQIVQDFIRMLAQKNRPVTSAQDRLAQVVPFKSNGLG